MLTERHSHSERQNEFNSSCMFFYWNIYCSCCGFFRFFYSLGTHAGALSASQRQGETEEREQSWYKLHPPLRGPWSQWRSGNIRLSRQSSCCRAERETRREGGRKASAADKSAVFLAGACLRPQLRVPQGGLFKHSSRGDFSSNSGI